MSSYDQHYYDGAWQASSGTETIAVISSATEAEVARVPVEDPAQWLEKLAAAMKTGVPQPAEAIAHEVGTSLADATKKAKFIREARLEEGLGSSLVSKEPIGVVGCITPWTW